jgi:hypothetical protein
MRISILGNNYRLKNQNYKDEKLNGKIKKHLKCFSLLAGTNIRAAKIFIF